LMLVIVPGLPGGAALGPNGFIGLLDSLFELEDPDSPPESTPWHGYN
jgi:hypothetical protein